MSVEIRFAYNDIEKVKTLFYEYTNMLIESNSDIKAYLELQNYYSELNDLNEKYGLPQGRLYIALFDNQLAGCIALRSISEECCEMKRLYVRPQFRGKKIARSLIELIINDAKETGYNYIVLDTLPFLREAIEIYKMFGFYEIPQYNDSPIEGTVFLRKDL